MYSVAGQSAALAATIDLASFQVWNGHATQRIKLMGVNMALTTTGTNAAGVRATRTSARGTVTSSVTPTVVNDSKRGAAPPSGLTLDLTFSAQPTLDGNNMFAGVGFSGGGGGDGWFYDFDGGVWIPPGTGIAFVNWTAIALVALLVTAYWIED